MGTLQQEMARQDEVITKLQAERKGLEDTLRTTQDELSAEEDRVSKAPAKGGGRNKVEVDVEKVMERGCKMLNQK